LNTLNTITTTSTEYYKIKIFFSPQGPPLSTGNSIISSPGHRPRELLSSGSHVGFPISAKNKNLVYDHPMNISAKFDSNLFCGFRKKDENVKS
jgi:hypothetical protein